MKDNIQNLQSLGTMAAIHALFHHDCELQLADGLMFAEAGANVAANLVYIHSTSTQEVDEALHDLIVFDYGDIDQLLRIAFFAAFEACEAYHRGLEPCP